MLRCSTCNGFKSIAPLGGIVKTCPDCKGIGYVEHKLDSDKSVTPDTKPDYLQAFTNLDAPIVSKPTKIDKRSKQYRQSIGR